MSVGTPKAEQHVEVEDVRSLLRTQHPDLVEEHIELFETGFDNYTFRLGDTMAIRLPRREIAAQLVLNEQRCLPLLAPRLPIPIPAPIRVGVPAANFPWSWSILPWLPGRAADEAPPDADQAIQLATFLRALHQPAPSDAPENPFRGVALAVRQESIEERFVRLREKTELIGGAIDEGWAAALAAPPSTEAMWLHGDMHARNMLVDGGRISGVIDFGDITSGDVATDLASIWALFEDVAARRRALSEYAADTATIQRARGWAIAFGAMLLDTGLVDDPRHAAMGRNTLRRIAEDDF